MGWLKRHRLAGLIVLLLAVSSAYGLHSLSAKQRWAFAHNKLMPQLQEAMRGKTVEADLKAIRNLPPRLRKLYPLGMELAQKRYDARKKCTQLAAEGLDLICTQGGDFIAGKRDPLSVFNAAKSKSTALESVNREYLSAHLDFSNWQGESFAAWNEVWPEHTLDLSLKGSGLYLDVDANRLAPVQQKLQARSNVIWAPRDKDRSYRPSEDDYLTSSCISELFQLNNAVFNQAANFDGGAAYICRGPKENWIDRLLARKQAAPQQHNAGTFTSQPVKTSP